MQVALGKVRTVFASSHTYVTGRVEEGSID